MVYAPHHRIECSGTIDAGGGVTGEIFSFSLASMDTETDEVLCAAVAPVIVDWFHAGGSSDSAKIPAWCTLTQVRVESINADGTVASSYATEVDSVGSWPPGSGAAPAICCFAITLETAAVSPKGARIRGRFFPPNGGYYPVGNPPLSAGTDFGTNIAQSGAVLVTNLNAAGAVICVASQTGGGVNAAVTGTSADNVVDTIRRRKNSAVGTRGTQAVPFSG